MAEDDMFYIKPEVRGRQQFMLKVHLTLGKDRNIYIEYLNVLKEYRIKAIEPGEATLRICELLKQHPDIIVEFNDLLPPNFILRFKDYVGEDGHTTKKALWNLSSHILGMTHRSRKPPLPAFLRFDSNLQKELVDPSNKILEDANATCQQDHLYTRNSMRDEDTLEDFKKCSSDLDERNSDKSTVYASSSRSENISGIDGDESKNENKSDDEYLWIEKVGNESEPNDERSYFESRLNINSSSTNSASSGNEIHVANAVAFVRKVKKRFKKQPFMYEKFLDIFRLLQQQINLSIYGVKDATTKAKSEIEVYKEFADVFRHHGDLVEQFRNLLFDPDNFQVDSEES